MRVTAADRDIAGGQMPEPAGNNLLAAALALADRGWSVFPCHRDKTPATMHGVKDATADPARIRGWWSARPDASIGLACGPSGLVVIDLDVAKGALAAWRGLKAAHGIDDETLTSITGGGGWHLFYRSPEGFAGRNSASKLGPGIDVRAVGGYVIAPPSGHPSGKHYLWDPDRAGLEPILLPDSLRALLEGRDRAAAGGACPQGRTLRLRSETDRCSAQGAPLGMPAGTQSKEGEADRRYGAAALRNELAALGRAAEGARNDALNRAAFSLGQLVAGGALDRRAAERELVAAAQAIGLGAREALATVQSGLAAGERTPRAAPAAPAADEKDVRKKRPPLPTDDELAARWLADHPDTAWGMGEFRRYAAGIWTVAPQDVVRGEIKTTLMDAKAEGVRPTARLLASVLELARVEIAQAPGVWDADPDILVCANGALHIPTRTLQPHSPQHWATSKLSFAYDPAARAETWQRVLDTCCAGQQEFLQEFAGYCLTTDTRHEIAVWLAGPPGGGKSTVLEGLRAMLGSRVCLLGLADIERSRFALTHLPGKTLALSMEQPGGYVAATALLNSLISGEPISVDLKFRDPVTLVPRVKLAWALNELPRVGPEGVGLFRRVKVLRFPALPEAARDPGMKERVRGEGAGILNWALAGLARLRQRGCFEIPAAVQEATDAFRASNDIPAAFVAECCVTGCRPETGQPYRAPGSALYKAYGDWCRDNGHKPLSSTSIAEDWRRFGFVKYRSSGTSWWRGVGLVNAPAGQGST